MLPRRCERCPAIGDTWMHRGQWLCDDCLTRIEEKRTKELPLGEERAPRAWATWTTRPITDRELRQRSIVFAGDFSTSGIGVDVIINSRIEDHDNSTSRHRLSSTRDTGERMSKDKAGIGKPFLFPNYSGLHFPKLRKKP